MGIEMNRNKSIELNNKVSDYLAAVEDEALPEDVLKDMKSDLIKEVLKYESNGNTKNMLYMLNLY